MKNPEKTCLKRNRNVRFFAVALLTIFLSTELLAAPSDLDLRFGVNGIVVTPIDDSSAINSPLSMLVQPDRKIVVSGFSVIYDEDCECQVPTRFFYIRYFPSGVLDPSFGTNGKEVTAITLDSGLLGVDIALQPDGKIVAVGSNNYRDFAINRYNSDGSLDTSFGTAGQVVTSMVDFQDIATKVEIQPDGKIVVAGLYNSNGVGYAVARYNPNGSLDTTFGTEGKVITPMGTFGLPNLGALLLQPDGKIIAVGDSNSGNTYNLVRYNADGSLDSSFGSNGIVSHGLSGYSVYRYHDAALQPDGKIIGAGAASNQTVVLRYNANGSRDMGFGNQNGIFVSDFFLYVGKSIALQTDGKIAAFGYKSTNGGRTTFAVERLNAIGTPDTAFGNNGIVLTPAGSSGSEAWTGAVQADGKILALGTAYTPTGTHIAIVRYLGDSIASRPARFDFDGDGRSDVSVFRPSGSIWYLNRSTAGFSATQFGLSTDDITAGDFDGDGKTDIAVYRDGVWWWINSSNNVVSAVQFGSSGDVPVIGNFTGDPRDELAVYRSGTWWTYDISRDQTTEVQFGLPADRPVSGDYDGDGRADQAVYRNGEWHINRSSLGYIVARFGLPTDIPVPADYDGDGKTDTAVYRSGTWYLSRSTGGMSALQFGSAADIPTPADYDGDGRTDIAVYRNGTWYILKSSNGSIDYQQFGLSTDIPISGVHQ